MNVRSREFEFDLFQPPATEPIAHVSARDRVAVRGIVTVLAVRQLSDGTPALDATVTDTTGSLLLSFFGRTRIAGIEVGRLLTAAGTVVDRGGRLAVMNPFVWLGADDAPTEPRLLEDRTPAFT